MKKLLKIFGALLALLIVIAIALPMFISAEYLKTQLQDQVKKATGRELVIKGKVSLSVLPNIAVNVEDVKFGNPAGFASPYFVHIDKLAVGAALKPFLSQQLRVTGITLDGAQLNMEENAAGAKNWSFTKATTPGKPQAQAAVKEAKKSGEQALIIEAITLKNVAVNYRKAGAKPMKLEATNIATDIHLNGPVTKIALGNASLYGGTAKGDVTMNSESTTLAAKLDLSGIQIEPLMTALSGASRLKGATDLTLDVTGKGAEQAALMHSLNGSGTLKITDGAIKGINVASFLRDAKRGFIVGESSAETTDFTELNASYAIANGVLSNEDLLMKSPILRLTGKGAVNLAEKTINYRAVPSIVGTLKGQGGKDRLSGGGLDIPLIITGPWSAISVSPDMVGMLQNGLKDPEALKQNLKDLKGDIGKFNSPKDIGAALFGGKKEAEPAAATTTPSATSTPAATETTPAQKQKLNVGDLLNGLGK